MSTEQTDTRPATGDSVDTAAYAGRQFAMRDHYEVGREKVREFARAVRNKHGAHHFEPDARKLGYEGVLAPPTFSSVIGMSCTRALLDSVLTEYDLSQVLQTDQVFEQHRPIVAGDSLTTAIRIESVRHFGDTDIVQVSFTLTNQRGEVAQIGTTTMVARRGAHVDPEMARAIDGLLIQPEPEGPSPLVELPAEHVAPSPTVDPEPQVLHTLPDFDTLAPGTALPPASATLTRGDLVNYAGVSGDPNPIHFSEHAARLVGLPTVVGHGLLTMGLAADYLTDWAGDPTAVTRFSVRFAGYVPVGSDAPARIDFGGRVKSLDRSTRTAAIALTGHHGDRKLFGRALAEIRFA
ncbi:fused (3R)-hydroxyacyl-ACP dehydratase subunits HadA/HadB [Nocardia takedensis]